MARQKHIAARKDADRWVITYADLMSLLLTFFVLIVSFSSLQEAKFHQAARSLKDAFGVMRNPDSVLDRTAPRLLDNGFRERDAEFLYEVRSIEKEVLDRQRQDDVAVEIRRDGVLFRLTAPFLFASGRADLRPDALPLLDRLARMFRKFPAEVRIEGHTDNVPIHTARFPSNWELSAARAVAVARYFQSVGLPAERLAATGFGENHPVATNDTPEGRAANRRVEILLKWTGRGVPRRGDLPLKEPGAAAAAVPDPAAGAARGSAPAIIDPVTSHLRPLPRPTGK